MTYALAILSPPWALSAGALLPKRWSAPLSAGTRYLSEPRVTTSSALPPMEFQQVGGWSETARQRLSELANLKSGWDDASAPPIVPSLIETAWNFLTSELVSSLEVKPDIVPTLDGGLLIEWHTTKVDLIIESSPKEPGSFYFCDNETGDEFESVIGDNLNAIATAFIKLGVRL